MRHRKDFGLGSVPPSLLGCAQGTVAASRGERTQRADADVWDVDLPQHLGVLGWPSPFCPAGLGPSCPWVTPVCWRAPDLAAALPGRRGIHRLLRLGSSLLPKTGSGASPAGRRCPIAAWRASGHLMACGVQMGAASSHLHPPPETLCLWVRLSWTFAINGITHRVSFCVWFLPLHRVLKVQPRCSECQGFTPFHG